MDSNAALIAVHDVVIKSKKQKRKKWEKYTLLILSLVGFVFFFYVYNQWQIIPTKKEQFQIEQLSASPKDSVISFVATVSLNENKGVYFYSQSPQDYGTGAKAIGSISFSVSPKENKDGHCVLRKKKLSDLIDEKLYNRVQDTFNSNHLVINDFSGIFYLRRLSSTKETPLRLSIKNVGNNNIAIDHVNDGKVIIDTNIIPILWGESIQDYMEKLGYKTIQESLIIKYDDYDKTSASGTSKRGVFLSSQLINKIRLFFKSEDVSKAYYKVSVHSNTMKDVVLILDFSGAIKIIKDVNYSMNNEGMTSVTIRGNGTTTFFIEFMDLQNMQTIRLFIIAALMTLCITTFIKTIWSLWVAPRFNMLKTSECNNPPIEKNELININDNSHPQSTDANQSQSDICQDESLNIPSDESDSSDKEGDS